MSIEGDCESTVDHRVTMGIGSSPGNPVPKNDAGATTDASSENKARAMGEARLHIKDSAHVANCRRADPAYGAAVAEGAGHRIRPQENAEE